MSYFSRRKQSVRHDRKSFEKIQPEVSLWKSPFAWLCGLGGMLLVGVPLLVDGLTHRVVGTSLKNYLQAS